MNYMDYTNDLCMYMFTNDQKFRAQLIMTHSALRLSLLTSTVCSLPTATNDIGIMYVSNPTYSQTFNCTNSISPVVVAHNYGSNTITSATYSFNVDGVNTQTMAWIGNLVPNGNATVTLPPIFNISNGSHQYHVGAYAPNGGTDANTLNNVNAQFFVVNAAFTLSVSGTQTLCSGGSTTLTVSGGANSYTWYPSSTTGSVMVVSSPAASIVFTVVGSTSACVNSRTVAVSVIPVPTLTLNSPTVCSGGSAQLTAQGACTYTWMPGNLTGTSITQSPSGTTQYSVTGSCGGCSAMQTTTLTVTNLPTVNVSIAPNGSLCAGGTATLTATGAANYSWSAGGSGSQLVVTPSTNTGYTVTGANGPCSSTASAMVQVGASTLAITFAPSPATLCAGSTLTLTALGATSYTWTGGGANTDLVVSPATNTTYTVSGTNGACSATASIMASVIPVPTVVVSASPAGSVCAGTSVTLAATGASQYAWSDNSQAPTVVITPTVSSVVTVTGSAQGCSHVVNVPVALSGSTLGLNVTASAHTICSGSTVTLTASGLGTYTWNTGTNFPSIVVSPTTSTAYTMVGHSGPCAGQTVIAISVLPGGPIQLSVQPSPTVCAGNAATLSASGNYSLFTWSTGGSGSVIQVLPAGASTYTVFGAAATGGCAGSATVTVYTAPSPVSALSVTNTACLTGSCTGIVNAQTTGGVGPYTYVVAGSSCTTLPCAGLCAGLHKLTTVDSMGCASNLFFSVECKPENTTGFAAGVADHLRVFPNPVTGSFVISGEGAFSFRIFNALGMEIAYGACERRADVDASQWARGLYFVEMRSNAGVNTARIIKADR
jgi:hypothetical protein